MKNKAKNLVSLFLLAILVFVSVVPKTSAAAPDTIQLGKPEMLEGYIEGFKFETKTTEAGEYLYCLDFNKFTAKYGPAKLVGERDAGVAAIVANGYPNKTITGDWRKDYYITQCAVWWYLDDTANGDNLGPIFKTTGSDPHNLRPEMKKLVAIGKKAKEEGYKKTKLEVSISNSEEMTLNGDTYISNEIYVKEQSNISNYTVSIKQGPKGTKIIDSKGNEKNTFGVNEKFKVKVPASSIVNTEEDIVVTVKATGTVYKAYEYKPVDPTKQPITPALLTPIKTDVTDEVKLNVKSSKISIVKIDKKTDKPLAGAELVLKDKTGKVVAKWTSSVNAYNIRNLTPGVYFVEETKAPEGYLLNKEPVMFKITDKNQKLEVKFYNDPKSTVVNILKVNKNTNEPLAGATLVVEDAKGNKVAEFVTTDKPYVLTNLKDGTYTVKEISAPEGYVLSDEVMKFTIDDEHLSHQIVFGNVPKTIVPDTATSSTIIFTILGITIMSFGLGFVLKNAKQK